MRAVRGALLCSIVAILAACAAPRDERDSSTAQSAAEPPRDTQYVPEASNRRAAQDQLRAREALQKAEQHISEVTVTGTHTATSRVYSPAVESYSVAPAFPCCPPPQYQQPANTERYDHRDDNPVRLAAEQPVSTFSIDVDTGAYANVRRFLNGGQLPPQDAVRVEELINYFDYQYPTPAARDTPFRVTTELSAAPWNARALLLRIGIKGYEVPAAQRPPANLVFLIDVSGSMQDPQKLPLLKNAFRLLINQLSERDRVSMVVYAGSSGVVLEPTPGDQKHKIRAALDRLEAGGSTNGAEGIERAYELARAARVDGGINRVVLATDGDFNVGVVDFEALVDMAERQRASGIALTTLGFGTGNYNDRLLERLANAGDGNYSYVDNLSEARKVLVSELSSTLLTIAKDVKIQIEFNPAKVLEYRLLGYENRMLAREDFNNDRVDAGEIGAGHRVTALYEIIPVGAQGRVDPLRYGPQPSQSGRHAQTSGAGGAEIAHLRLRYKRPASDSSELLEYPIAEGTTVPAAKASADFRFAASVAAFGQLLRGGKYMSEFGYDDVVTLAQGAFDRDPEGYRREFVALVKLAEAVAPAPGEQKVSQND